VTKVAAYRLDDVDRTEVELPDNEPTSVHEPLDPLEPLDFVRTLPSRRSIAPPALVLAPGGTVGKYELTHNLGQGTFGLVFTARDPDLDRAVALKVLNPAHATNRDLVQRFLQEARATARIAHPGVVTLLDFGRVPTSLGETAYITMELLQGESLTSRLTRCGRLPPGIAVEIARQVASALDAAHRVEVLHRDLKPDNIYLVADPAVASGERVKVLDFGLAKLGVHGHTLANTVFGTPRYMSPEQCRSSGQIDHRSDIYALGCILFELVTGRTPFDGDMRQLISLHQRAMPPRASSFALDLTAELDDLIDRMLAKDPAARPQTMDLLQRELQHLGAAEVAPAPTMMPIAAHRVSLPALAFDGTESVGELLVPPHVDRMLPPEEEMTPTPPPRRRRHRRRSKHRMWIAAAIAFVVAALLTAAALRAAPSSHASAAVTKG
jgi:serine/threonine protein kinase